MVRISLRLHRTIDEAAGLRGWLLGLVVIHGGSPDGAVVQQV
jgi:hypothetical protein